MSDGADPGEALATIRGVLRGDDRDQAAGTFMRGLTLGALIGAAIAGSALWQRRARREQAGAGPSTDVPNEAPESRG